MSDRSPPCPAVGAAPAAGLAEDDEDA